MVKLYFVGNKLICNEYAKIELGVHHGGLEASYYKKLNGELLNGELLNGELLKGTGSELVRLGSGMKEMDRYRCTLRPETVEALYCAKDWLRSEIFVNMDSVVKMEFPI
ncbi:hypothetical protein Tco_1362518 [Tanacetum coccineum]